jgi:hypothetical protein
MALVLGAHVGDVFLVGRRRICVASIDGPTKVTLKRDDGQAFVVGSEMVTEVLPDVFICIGPQRATWRLRLVFDAPRAVVIRRDEARPR